MHEFERSTIWVRGLGLDPGQDETARERLRSAYFNFRSRSETLASEIARDIPSLTVHDISHIDALWEIADLIIGPELLESKTPFLNPLETFVLGSAFLVHDLAHARSAIPLSDKEIENQDLYRDVLADVLSDHYGNSQESTFVTDEEDRKRAMEAYLRASHSSAAENLLSISWLDSCGHAHYLLTDDDLRESLGETIGRVAASHHWSLNRLQSQFGTIGAPSFLPSSWKCDSLKLACIIRLADVAQIDSRRAPTFLAAIRKPTGESKKHWDFQQRVHCPVRQDDRIIYTSGSSFPIQMADAWWLGFDMLNMINAEIREVDSLLIDAKRPRFAVRAVAGVEDPSRLAKYIPTQGWYPIDTQIRVGNVATLASRLGGRQLYGNNILAPLRELIQNAGDAVRARRLIEGHDDDWGDVDIALFKRSNEWILQVTDNGVGMSRSVLTGPLLDFGSSFWKSSEAAKEHPGLKGKHFRPTGQYGIGFFSVFMLGKKVKVISRRYDLGVSDTTVLEFSEGPAARPILRGAEGEERNVCGTRVEISLFNDPEEQDGLLNSSDYQIPRMPLAELCAWLCPSFGVNIRVLDDFGKFHKIMRANDWKTLSAVEMMNRIEKTGRGVVAAMSGRIRKRSIAHLRPLFSSNGEILGRAYFELQSDRESHMYRGSSAITVGGCRSRSVDNVSGIIMGQSDRASRDSASVLVSKKEVQRWAEEQRSLIETSRVNKEIKSNIASILRGSGIGVGTLPIALSRKGWLTVKAIEKFAESKDHIVLTSHLYMRFGTAVDYRELSPNVLVTEAGENGIYILFPFHHSGSNWNDPEFHKSSLEGCIIEAVAKAWKLSMRELLVNASHSTDRKNFRSEVGKDKYGHPVIREQVSILYRANAGHPTSRL